MHARFTACSKPTTVWPIPASTILGVEELANTAFPWGYTHAPLRRAIFDQPCVLTPYCCA
jgi:hypothetical protein